MEINERGSMSSEYEQFEALHRIAGALERIADVLDGGIEGGQPKGEGKAMPFFRARAKELGIDPPG
jgi:hypothetical protein